MSIKINKLEIENIKRVKAVRIEPTASGLTVIGGKNQQGKTSVLDAIVWALGGNKYRPSNPQREGSTIPPNLHLVMSNGLVVERRGKNSDLKVIDPDGNKAGQQLLNEFVEQLALDLPKFMEMNNKEKANTLLKIIGVGDKLYELEQKENEVYNQRHAIGQIADQKEKYAKEQSYYPDAPKEPVSASDLIKQQQEILAKNGENQRMRDKLGQLEQQSTTLEDEIEDIEHKIAELVAKKDEKLAELTTVYDRVKTGEKTVAELQDESTAELEASISNIEEINRKVRANLDKDKAEQDAQNYRDQYAELTTQIEGIRKAKTDLLSNANLPLPGLSVEDGELTFNGQKWDGMSGSEQLRVSTAIVRQLNPNCGFVLLDKLEQMDLDTLKEFGEWLEQEGLQAIATRVSTGEECSIIIEDGYVQGQETIELESPKPAWKAGEF